MRMPGAESRSRRFTGCRIMKIKITKKGDMLMIRFIVYQKIKKDFLALLIAFIFLVFVFALPVLAADDAVTEGYNMLRPIPGTKYEGSHDFRRDAEKYYDFIGTVDDVQNEGLVVGDSYMKFSPKAKVSGARPGTPVGIVLNDAGEVLLCEPFIKPVGR